MPEANAPEGAAPIPTREQAEMAKEHMLTLGVIRSKLEAERLVVQLQEESDV